MHVPTAAANSELGEARQPLSYIVLLAAITASALPNRIMPLEKAGFYPLQFHCNRPVLDPVGFLATPNRFD